jgi:hypothetical protein
MDLFAYQIEETRMKRATIMIAAMAAFVVIGAADTAYAQGWYRGQPMDAIRDCERETDDYKRSLDRSLDSSRFNGTRYEDEINRYVREFEAATDQLRRRAEDRQRAPAAARETLNRGRRIDVWMRNHRMTPECERDWREVREALNRIAWSYNISWRW